MGENTGCALGRARYEMEAECTRLIITPLQLLGGSVLRGWGGSFPCYGLCKSDFRRSYSFFCSSKLTLLINMDNSGRLQP